MLPRHTATLRRQRDVAEPSFTSPLLVKRQRMGPSNTNRPCGTPERGSAGTYARRMGRVRQVGPPPPLRPISAACEGMDLASRCLEGAPRPRVAVGDDHDPRPDRQDVAAQRRELILGDRDEPDPQVTQQLPQARRQERLVDHGEVVGDRRDDRQEVQQLARPVPVGQVEDACLAPGRGGERRELPGPGVVRAQAAADAQQVRPEPERIAAIDRARRLDRADGRDAMVRHPGGEDRRLRAPADPSAAEREGALVGHQQRVERVDVVGAARLDVECLHLHPERRQQVHQRVMFSLRKGQVDRVQEAERRVLERPPERRTGPLDQDAMKRRHHALGPERSLGQRSLPARRRGIGCRSCSSGLVCDAPRAVGCRLSVGVCAARLGNNQTHRSVT